MQTLTSCCKQFLQIFCMMQSLVLDYIFFLTKIRLPPNEWPLREKYEYIYIYIYISLGTLVPNSRDRQGKLWLPKKQKTALRTTLQ